MTPDTTRRGIMVASALGALGAVAGVTSASAKGMTDAEKSNIEKVKAFLTAFTKKDVDYDTLMKTYLNDDASVRFDALHTPGIIGPAAAALQARATTPKDAVFEFRFDKTFAKGPVVITVRTDIMKIPGAPDHVFNVVGVHVFKNGKMQEYADYFEM